MFIPTRSWNFIVGLKAQFIRRTTMLNVTLVTNDGDGGVQQLTVNPGITLGTFLDFYLPDRDLDDFTIRVRSDGESFVAETDYVLRDGDKVTLAPQKIEGA